VPVCKFWFALAWISDEPEMARWAGASEPANDRVGDLICTVASFERCVAECEDPRHRTPRARTWEAGLVIQNERGASGVRRRFCGVRRFTGVKPVSAPKRLQLCS